MDYNNIYLDNRYLRNCNRKMFPYLIKESLPQASNYCASMNGWNALYWTVSLDIEADIRYGSIDEMYRKYNYPKKNTLLKMRVPYANGNMVIYNNMHGLSSATEARFGVCFVIPNENIIALVSFVGRNTPPCGAMKLSDIDFDN